MHNVQSGRTLCRGPLVLAASILMLLVAGAGPASAGRLLVTGHDTDFHCDDATGMASQCHFFQTALGYVRAKAPDPSKPVLVIDNSGAEAVHSTQGAGAPLVAMDPASAGFAMTPINTATYSAIVVASDSTCGGCDLNQTATGDSDAINARKADIEAFFNTGGGIFFAAGADHADGDATNGADVYYNAVPIPVGGVAVSAPFTLTAAGKALGFEDSTHAIGTHDDINCCATHNSFSLPAADSALTVAETDSKGFAETLFADGSISGGKLVKKVPTTCLSIPGVVRDQVKRAPGGGRVLLKTRQVDDPAQPLRTAVRGTGGAKVSSVTIKANGKLVSVSSTGATSVGVSLLRLGSKAKRNKLTATVTLTNGKRVVLTQFMIILRCHVPPTSCKRKADGRTVVCKSGTPLGGRRVKVTLLGTGGAKATGKATVKKGRYTVTLHSAIVLGPGTYTYKHTVTTKKPRQRYFMIRLVTVA